MNLWVLLFVLIAAYLILTNWVEFNSIVTQLAQQGLTGIQVLQGRGAQSQILGAPGYRVYGSNRFGVNINA